MSDGAHHWQKVSVGSGWQSWATIAGPTATLTQGAHRLRLTVVTGGFNLDWLELGES
jgi:hypothetical protein